MAAKPIAVIARVGLTAAGTNADVARARITPAGPIAVIARAGITPAKPITIPGKAYAPKHKRHSSNIIIAHAYETNRH